MEWWVAAMECLGTAACTVVVTEDTVKLFSSLPPFGYQGMYDPMLGAYGAPPAANFVDDHPDAHRIEHAFRQSMPDSYGMGTGMLPGGMAINTLVGSQMLLYGRGMAYNGWYA
ncbi:hypothetical protein I312_104824 [Cryptococcus bacillisporus CA1280]|uniref:uncharacterized protein n=1 Tax=Cryptococcus bacillisporus CA1280 TaxID=1296109 RepID=UPI003367D2CE